MSETMALVRLCCIRSRTALIGGIALLFCVQVLLIWARLLDFVDYRNAIAFSSLGLLPLGLMTIVLFDCGSGDLSKGDSGYNAWLLRTPIPEWKLAVVPLTLKAIWLVVIWMISMGTVYFTAGQLYASPSPAVTLAAATTWICFLSWRPFSGRWMRLWAALVLMVVSYVAVVFSIAIAVDSSGIKQYRSLILAFHNILPWSFLIAGAVFCVRAVKLARSNHSGLISESIRYGWLNRPMSASQSRLSQLATWPARDATGWRSMLAMELRRTSGRIVTLGLLGWIPMILLFSLLVPFHISTLIVLLFATWCIGAMTNVGAAYEAEGDSRAVASWIGATPIKSATMAWARIAMLMWVGTTAFLAMVLTCIGWSFWPSNQEAWFRFAAQMEASYGSPSAAYGIALAAGVAAFLTLVCFNVRLAWQAMSGRTWVQVVTGVVLLLLWLAGIGSVTRFFLVQTSWEGTRETALQLASYIPMLMAIWLVLKTGALVGVITLLRRQRLESVGNIAKWGIGWSVLVVGLGYFFHWTLPLPWTTLTRCLAAVAVFLPLPSLLATPISLAWNRHR